MPTFNREREIASQVLVSVGISTTGVGRFSGTGVVVAASDAVGDKVAVAVGRDVGVRVGAGVFVHGIGVEEMGTVVGEGGDWVCIAGTGVEGVA